MTEAETRTLGSGNRLRAHGLVATARSWLEPGGGLGERFARGAVWSLIGAVFSTGFTQLATIVNGRILGVEGLGTLALIQSTVVLGGALGGSGIGLAATKHLAAARTASGGAAGDLARAARLVGGLAGGLISLLLFACCDLLSTSILGRIDLAGALRLSSPLVMFNVVFSVQQGVMAGFEDYRGIASANLWRGVSVMCLSLLLAPKFGVEGAIWAMVLSTAMGVGLCELSIMRWIERTRGGKDCSRRIMKAAAELWRSALPVLLSGVAVGAGNWLANAILAKSQHGFRELGQFYAADRWRMLCVFIATYAGAAALPVLSSSAARGDSVGFKGMTKVNCLFALGATVPLALGTAMLCKLLMAVYGPEYAEAWPVMLVLALSSIPMVLNSALGQTLLGRGRFWYRAICDFGLMITTLALFIQAPIVTGALKLALAQVMAYSAVTILVYLRVSKDQHTVSTPNVVHLGALQ